MFEECFIHPVQPRQEPFYYQLEQPKRFEGATVQATFPIPPVSQPDRQVFDAIQATWWNRPEPVKRFEGATKLDTKPIPPVGQPEPTWWQPFREDVRYQAIPVKRFEGATNQQTYVFPVNQPDFTRPLAQVTYQNVYLVPRPRPIEGLIPKQTFPVPFVYQPTWPMQYLNPTWQLANPSFMNIAAAGGGAQHLLNLQGVGR